MFPCPLVYFFRVWMSFGDHRLQAVPNEAGHQEPLMQDLHIQRFRRPIMRTWPLRALFQQKCWCCMRLCKALVDPECRLNVSHRGGLPLEILRQHQTTGQGPKFYRILWLTVQACSPPLPCPPLPQHSENQFQRCCCADAGLLPFSQHGRSVPAPKKPSTSKPHLNALLQTQCAISSRHHAVLECMALRYMRVLTGADVYSRLRPRSAD